ncbi:toprim domain-containing protein [Shimia sp.]|uniref:DUF7146 domain-containing protein n=1 Tax=Shimia sp. TaxID=1954381 RepID=UPI00329A1BC0
MDENYFTAEQLTDKLGGQWQYNVGRAPCPAHNGTDNNLAVSNGENGIPVLHCHSHGCDFLDIVAALRDRGLRPGRNAANYTPPTPAERRQAAQSKADDEQARIKVAMGQWNATVPLAGTLSDRYLHRTRGRDGTGVKDLRHHPKIYYSKTEFAPALVAAIRNITTGKITGVHRTFLTETGQKITRTVKGRQANGAIMLDPMDSISTGLAICEGIEDGLAIQTIQRPVWCLINKGGIAKFPVLPGIEHVTIYADNDEAGRGAADECRLRWTSAGIDVTVRIANGGKDADEVLP